MILCMYFRYNNKIKLIYICMFFLVVKIYFEMLILSLGYGGLEKYFIIMLNKF